MKTKDCNLHLIPTNNPAPFLIENGELLYSENFGFDLFDINNNFKHINKRDLIITSNDPIEIGDIVYNECVGICECSSELYYCIINDRYPGNINVKKVIASTSNEFSDKLYNIPKSFLKIYKQEMKFVNIDDLLKSDDYIHHYSSYWSNGIWRQPPVKIKHGDLVYVKCENYSGELIGRYIGKGYGVVELYDYSTGTKHIIGKVISRGIDINPRLVSDEILFNFIND